MEMENAMRKDILIIIALFSTCFMFLITGCSADINVSNQSDTSPVSSVMESSEQDQKFEDVQDSSIWYYKPVYWAVRQKVTKGTSETAFSPDQSCTRAEIVTFLWRYFGQQNVDLSISFDDVSPEEYYYDAIRWAVENQITNGISPDIFSPDAFCTRAQMVTFIWRCAQTPESNEVSKSFSDVPENEYYAQAVRWALENHITYGVSDTEFSPDSFCSRSEVVTFLYRSVQILGDVTIQIS